jgi:transcriptional regulator with XRE-family HTH domain
MSGAHSSVMIDGDRLRARLREISDRKGLGIFEWPVKAGLANATIQNLLLGKSNSMRPKTLQLLADAAGMTLDELLSDDAKPQDAVLAAIEAMRAEHVAILQAILEELRAARGKKAS